MNYREICKINPPNHTLSKKSLAPPNNEAVDVVGPFGKSRRRPSLALTVDAWDILSDVVDGDGDRVAAAPTGRGSPRNETLGDYRLLDFSQGHYDTSVERGEI